MENVLKYQSIFEYDYRSRYIPSLESNFKKDLYNYLQSRGYTYETHEGIYEPVVEMEEVYSMNDCEVVSLMLDIVEFIGSYGGRNLTDYQREFVTLFQRLRELQ